ncbi:MAG: hypothetical protein IT580_10065 [Verrucomicrobiales bacterium]|nr:hypothetical protein [Verrucomicrobiales bacterium]
MHCHHGKHRGPAAAAVLCLGTTGWSTNAAVAWMKQAGTSPEYAGLYRSVVGFTLPDPTRLPSIASLPEVARTTTVVEAMVRLDQHLEMLKLGQKASWQSIPQHPDLSLAQEAVLLLEQLRELARHPDSASREAEYRRLMAESITAAESLVALLQESAPSPSTVDQGLQRLSKTCSACHQPYRN